MTRYLMCIITVLAIASDALGDSASVKSKIGREDIYWCQDGVASTFNRRTSTGGLISLNCVGSAESGETNPDRNVYYISTSATVTDHSSASQTESLAWCVAQLPGAKGTVVFQRKSTNYVLLDNYTVPATVNVIRESGDGVIAPAVGKTLTINGHFDAPPETAFGGSGAVIFGTLNKEIQAKWFGGTNDGTTDDSAAIQDAYDSITDGTIVLSDDNWTFNLLVNKNHINVKGASRPNDPR